MAYSQLNLTCQALLVIQAFNFISAQTSVNFSFSEFNKLTNTRDSDYGDCPDTILNDLPEKK